MFLPFALKARVFTKEDQCTLSRRAPTAWHSSIFINTSTADYTQFLIINIGVGGIFLESLPNRNLSLRNIKLMSPVASEFDHSLYLFFMCLC